MAVERTMPLPCQKCCRHIICHRCSTRVGIFADDQLSDIFDRSDDAARVPFQRRFAPAEQPRLIGDDFDEHPVPHPGMADERFDGGDFHVHSAESM